MRLRDRVNSFCLVAFVGSSIIVYIIFDNFYDYNLNIPRRDFSRSSNRDGSSKKNILYWTTFFGNENFYFGTGDIFANCPNDSRNCRATSDRDYLNIDEFDALLIHSNDVETIDDLPNSIRNKSQIYFYVNLESPENRPITIGKMNEDYFNATMTYTLDSDVRWPYANIRELETGKIVAPSWDPGWKNYPNVTTGIRKTWNKTKTAIWFVSNCRAKSKRENYVRELAKHVDVDVFGKCGDETGCPRNRDCFGDIVEPNYYFYLSFENSMCDDYVTEKLYTAMKYNVVPVVYGGANYSRFAPPGSYINALDFDSPEELGNHLKDLIRRPEAYAKLFDWKLLYEPVGATGQAVCDLCRYLQDGQSTTKSYDRLNDWWTTDRCRLQRKLIHLPYLTKRDVVDEN